jgi:hypothetical protein
MYFWWMSVGFFNRPWSSRIYRWGGLILIENVSKSWSPSFLWKTHPNPDLEGVWVGLVQSNQPSRFSNRLGRFRRAPAESKSARRSQAGWLVAQAGKRLSRPAGQLGQSDSSEGTAAPEGGLAEAQQGSSSTRTAVAGEAAWRAFRQGAV